MIADNQWAPPPGASRPRSRRRVLVAMASSLALLAGAALAGSLVFDAGPQYPERWDPRVVELATFVEEHRGLTFKHPVHVYFLTADEYSNVTSGANAGGEPSEEDQQNSRDSTAEYRALGLMEGEPDLLEAGQNMADAGTLAFYSPVDDVVNVRGTEMTVGLQVTLAHELTHALQDQYFDLTVIGESPSQDESGAVRAVVEGDAVTTENAYIDTLSSDDQNAYYDEIGNVQTNAAEEFDDVPDVLQVLFGSYYAVGNAFVGFWQATPNADDDPGQLDEVLADPPTSSAQVFDPNAYIAGDPPAEVEVPESGDERFEWSSFGADFLFVMLAERIDPVLALQATDGWRGDSYEAVFDETTRRRICVHTNVELASFDDAREFHDAISAWAEAMPSAANAAVDDPDGTMVGFTSCDPGVDADMGLTGQAGDALGYPVARLQIAAGAVTGGSSRADALCYANAVIEQLSLDDIMSNESTPAIDSAIESANVACP